MANKKMIAARQKELNAEIDDRMDKADAAAKPGARVGTTTHENAQLQKALVEDMYFGVAPCEAVSLPGADERDPLLHLGS